MGATRHDRPGGAPPAGGASGARGLVGQSVASYRVIARLGEGGMGAVYLAEHTLLGRRAAVKVLHPEFSVRPDIVQRFFNEARASATLRHSGIVDIYDFGQLEDGTGYIVMELLEGESLATRLKRRHHLPPGEALGVLHQLCKPLGTAHQRGIVHRDLKPDNVFLVSDEDDPSRERVKILDFGIAKLSEGAGGSGGTRSDALLGTPVYMSPEQCEGAGHVDLRTDIYAMGVIAYEMLTGAPPFLGEGFGKILAMHIHAEPRSMRESDPRIPEEVDALVLRLLAKDRAQRPATCAALATEVEKLAASNGWDLLLGADEGAGTRRLDAAPAPAGQAPAPPSHAETRAETKIDEGAEHAGANEPAATPVARPTTLSSSAGTLDPRPTGRSGRGLPMWAVAAGAVVLMGAGGVGVWIGTGGDSGELDEGTSAGSGARSEGTKRTDGRDARDVPSKTPERSHDAPPDAPETAAPPPDVPATAALVAADRAPESGAEAPGTSKDVRTAKAGKASPGKKPGASAAPAPPGMTAAPGAPATLVLVSDPPAAVRLDGRPAGSTPLRLEGVAPGKHTITFETSGGKRKKVPVKLKSGEERTVSADLR